MAAAIDDLLDRGSAFSDADQLRGGEGMPSARNRRAVVVMRRRADSWVYGVRLLPQRDDSIFMRE
jgi:hypothetical protein